MIRVWQAVKRFLCGPCGFVQLTMSSSAPARPGVSPAVDQALQTYRDRVRAAEYAQHLLIPLALGARIVATLKNRRGEEYCIVIAPAPVLISRFAAQPR